MTIDFYQVGRDKYPVSPKFNPLPTAFEILISFRV